MKRPSLRHSSTNNNTSDDDDDDDDEQQLQSSLKRVRISTSPGELRLDRDLQQLGWTSGHRFLTKDILLERSHALGLTLVVSGTVRIYIDIPRMYPHNAPTICRVDGASFVTTTTTTTTGRDNAAAAAASCAWSPIKTLGDFIHTILQQLSESTSMAIDAIDAPTKHQSLFAPNRFDVGYDRRTVVTSSNSTTTTTTTTGMHKAMEC